MTDILRIKRRASGAPGAPASLASAELAYNEVDHTLYYGEGNSGGMAVVIAAIAGIGAYMDLSTNQTIATGIKTFSGTSQILAAGSAGVTVPTAAADTNSTAAASTAFVLGQAYTGTPAMDGVAAAGVATRWARGDHVHPHDTAMRIDQLTAPNGDVPWNSHKITGLLNPTGAQDAATKSYVDASVQGLQIKPTAAVATAAALPANVYSNGAAGVGATLTASANGALTVDGVAMVTAMVVLVKNEAAPANNGLYAVTDAGAAGAPYVLTRHADMDAATDYAGAFIPVGSGGTANANTLWLANPVGAVTVGTTAIPLTQLNSATNLSAGDGISIAANIVTAVGTANRITVGVGGIDISSAYVGQATITTLGTITTGVWNGTAVDVAHGGTGAGTLTGYVKGNGTSTMTASATIPNTDVAGLGSMALQAASAVAITGGTIDGITIDCGTF